MNRLIKYLTTVVLMTSFIQLFSEDIDRSINYLAQPVAGQDDCDPLEESYEENVFPARVRVKIGNVKDALELYKRHLECWYDKDVYIELGEFYESQNNYQLAEMSYKKAGVKERINQFNQKKLKIINDHGHENFERLAKIKSENYYYRFQMNKFGAISLFVFGSVAFSTGLVLFIHDKAGGDNSMTAQYTLMLGGLSMISGGVVLNAKAQDHFAISSSYSNLLKNYSCEKYVIAEDCYTYSGAETKTKKELISTYRKHGGIMLVMSIPMIAFAIYGFVDSTKYRKDHEDPEQPSSHVPFENIPFIFATIVQTLSFAPAILSLTGGFIMLAKASKYEKLSTEPSLFTLDTVTPIINPVSKTYGLALGFSF